MKDIVYRLFAIFAAAKDLHYASSGPNFYGLHLMYDRIADGLLDHADRIQEGYFMARNLPTIRGAEIFANAEKLIPNPPAPEALRQLIESTIYAIDELAAQSPELSEGDKTILGDISADLAPKAGFLSRTVKA